MPGEATPLFPQREMGTARCRTWQSGRADGEKFHHRKHIGQKWKESVFLFFFFKPADSRKARATGVGKQAGRRGSQDRCLETGDKKAGEGKTWGVGVLQEGSRIGTESWGGMCVEQLAGSGDSETSGSQGFATVRASVQAKQMGARGISKPQWGSCWGSRAAPEGEILLVVLNLRWR